MSLESETWFNPGVNEEVLWYSHPSFVMKLPKLMLGAFISFITLCGLTYGYFATDLPMEVIYSLLLFVPGGAIYSLYELLKFKNTWYVITNRRVISKSKIIGQDTTSKPHRQIVHFDIKVDILDRVISLISPEDIGNIIVRTADDRSEKFVMRNTPAIRLAESHLERHAGNAQAGSNSPARPANDPVEGPPDGPRDRPQTGSSPDQNTNSQSGNASPTGSEPSDTVTDEQTDDSFDEFEPSEYA